MSQRHPPRMYSFDEFKLYFESAEKVTDRRTETNRWNYSVCIGILVAVGFLAKWSVTADGLVIVGLTAIGLLCVVAVMFCVLWDKQIRDFKNLNNAKFAVLNDMAPLIEFDPEKPGTVVSFRPFEKEWKLLEEADALRKLGKARVVALKASNMELFVPRAFAIVYLAVLALVTLVSIIDLGPKKMTLPVPPPYTREKK